MTPQTAFSFSLCHFSHTNAPFLYSGEYGPNRKETLGTQNWFGENDLLVVIFLNACLLKDSQGKELSNIFQLN